MQTDFMRWFSQPVAFYAYTSFVASVILEIDACDYQIFGKDNITDDDKEIIEYIDDLFKRADKLHRRREDNYCSTREDNKTVIEMSDGFSRLFFGRYDRRYFIGLRALPEDERYRIDLSDITPQEWYKVIWKHNYSLSY